MRRGVAAVAALALLAAGTAQAVDGVPGTFVRDRTGGYFDACHVVRVVRVEQDIDPRPDVSLVVPLVQVTLDTRERVLLDYVEPASLVATVVAAKDECRTIIVQEQP